MLTDKCYTKRYKQLLEEINNHPYKKELINIMYNQLQDDKGDVISMTKY